MKKLLFSLLGLVALVFLFHSCEKTFVEDPVSEDLELKSANASQKTYIVVLNDAELDAELVKLKGYEKKQVAVKAKSRKILERAGITDGEIGFVYGTALKGFSVKMPPGQLKKLQGDASIKYIEEDQIVTLGKPDVRINKKPAPQPTAEVVPWGIKRVNGGVSYSGPNKIWIIDTGIDLDHPDLNVDKINGYNFIANTQVADDDNGHGSHCAGIAAAVDNSEGVIGVAAGAPVVPVKVLNRRGSGAYSVIIAGVDWVAENGIPDDVANMSLGGGYSDALNTAVINAAATGVKFTLAAGNESTSATLKSPASANGANIYTISAMGEGDVWSSYSNFDNPPVDYCEPGTYIYSTYKGGGYATLSGTSMAAPHAAGILLLGNISTDSYVSGDPDGNDDPIGVH